MARTLDVFLHRELVGHLIQDDGGQMAFDYAESWLQEPDATPLSHSLPLRRKRFKRNECRGYFAGILPEESKRETIALNLGISKRNDYVMLERIGGECAGAVTFIPAGENLPAPDDHYRALSAHELAGILKELPRRPLLAGETGIRLSLAGVQDKIAVRLEGDAISLPLGGAPSTHILKPAVERFAGVVFNEAFCMRLAAATGLPAAKAEIRRVEDVDYLLVERYDRMHRQSPEGSTLLERLIKKIFAKHWASSRNTNIKKKAARRSSNVSLCCERSPVRRSSTWRACWTQWCLTSWSATMTRTARIFHCSIAVRAQRIRRFDLRLFTMSSAHATIPS